MNPSDPTKPPAPASRARLRPTLGANRRLITLAEAAELLGMSTASVRRLVRSGKLHVVRLTRRLLVDLRDIDRLIEEAKDRTAWP